MDIFLVLLAKLIPLYLIILLGYLAGRLLHAQKETLASILIYVISPLVVFDGVLRTELSWSVLSLPLLFYTCCCLMCFLFYYIGSFFWKDAHRNILAFTSGDGNTGYFGLPVALAIFGPDNLGLVVLSLLGFVLFENSMGFYIVARGNYSAADSFRKVIKLPTIYAFIAGVLVNTLNIPTHEIVLTTLQNFRGAYSVFGMMIIGMGISAMRSFKPDYLFIGLAFTAKFAVWPLLVALIIFLDASYLHFYTTEIYRIMVLMSIVPLAANTVTLATQLKAEPEKAAFTVLLSTLFALFFIPLVVSLTILN